MTGREIELAIAELHRLPPLPPLADRLLQLSPAEPIDARALDRIFELSPPLHDRLLSLLRAAPPFDGAVAGLADAVRLAGFAALRLYALGLAVVDAFGPGPAGGHFDRHDFWVHSLGVGCAAELLAEARSDVAPSEAFAAGLLHGVGKLALATLDPDGYDRVVGRLARGQSAAEAEREEFGLDHHQAGRRLLARWGLPDALGQAAWLYALPPGSLGDDVASGRLIGVVHVAVALCGELRIGSASAPEVGSVDALVRQLNLPDGAAQRIRREIPERLQARAEAFGLVEFTDENQRRRWLERSHLELARLSRDLDRANLRLSRKASWLGLLDRLNASAEPDAPLGRVLQQVAEAWREILRADRAVCYAPLPDRDAVEARLAPAPAWQDGTLPLETRATDPSAVAAWLRDVLGAEPGCMLPIQLGPQKLGGIWLAGDLDFSGEEMAELAGVASATGLAIQRCLHAEQLRRQADALARANVRLQDQHRRAARAQKLEALGELSAGAAHEMNNPLAVISGRAQLLLGRETDADTRRMLTTIVQQAERVSHIVADLMNFARPPEPSFHESPAAEFVRAAVDEARNVATERQIELHLSADNHLPPLVADAGQLRSVMAELLNNAIEAIGQEGRIEVSTRRAPGDAGIEVVIRDTGRGISAEDLPKVFDPFFSGRDAGRGWGLGLAKGFRIAERHGGTIAVERTGPDGTTIVLSLPWQPPTESVPSS